ncbi:hypothetical protein D918_03827 [Trichuris suis]|nr:hypothetical protein D918_03827 [Trichuris suis]
MERGLLYDCIGLVSILLLAIKCRILFWEVSSWRHCWFILRTISYELAALCLGCSLGALYALPSFDRSTLLLLSLPTLTLSSSNEALDPNHSPRHFTLRTFVGDIFSSVPFYLAGKHIAWLFTVLVVINYLAILLMAVLLKCVISKTAQSQATGKSFKQDVMSCSFDFSIGQWLLNLLAPALALICWNRSRLEKADNLALILLVSLFRLAAQLIELPRAFGQSSLSSLDRTLQFEEQSPDDGLPIKRTQVTKGKTSQKQLKPTKKEMCKVVATKKNISKPLSSEDVLKQLSEGKLQSYALESVLADDLEAVSIRRQWFAGVSSNHQSIGDIPFSPYDYSSVTDACCENVLGFVPIPLGFAGPLKVDDQVVYIPMCTTEGCLVASVNRGCRALMEGSGVRTALLSDCMTRGPVVAFENVYQAARFKSWLEDSINFPCLAKAFEDTSRFAKLKTVQVALVGRFAFVRFGASTGDAMGMNMTSKGVEAVLEMLQRNHFPMLTVISLSGNYCVDKKSSAINWILGRGRSVTGEAILSDNVVRAVLKTDVDKLIQLNTVKNLVGSAKAGVVGGFNAHCANVVAAVFAATGQDLAQAVGSSQCLTFMEKTDKGDLRISCTMPCLEVGTVGGGTGLLAQKACLEILGCAGSCDSSPGTNARRLSQIICGAVLAGELSLLAALACGSLVRSHMRYNRKNAKLEKPTSNLSIDPASESQHFHDQLNGLADKCFLQDMVLSQSCSTAFM